MNEFPFGKCVEYICSFSNRDKIGFRLFVTFGLILKILSKFKKSDRAQFVSVMLFFHQLAHARSFEACRFVRHVSIPAGGLVGGDAPADLKVIPGTDDKSPLCSAFVLKSRKLKWCK